MLEIWKNLHRNIHTGSVLGKETLDTPFLVAQSGRFEAGMTVDVDPMEVVLVKEAKSFGGQVRFVPALIDKVGWPHWAQNGLRAFQSRRARACAYIAACSAGRDICIRPSTNWRPRDFIDSIKSSAAELIVPFGVTSRAK